MTTESKIDLSKAAEKVMAKRLIDRAAEFYSDSENLKAFEDRRAERPTVCQNEPYHAQRSD